MLPKAVADRIVAQPGGSNYSAISVMCNANCKTQFEFKVERDNYQPPPKIDSAVVTLKRTGPPQSPEFYKLVRASFSARRKKIKNSLSRYFSRPAVEIENILSACGISPMSRAQDLSCEQFKRLKKEFVNKNIL